MHKNSCYVFNFFDPIKSLEVRYLLLRDDFKTDEICTDSLVTTVVVLLAISRLTLDCRSFAVSQFLTASVATI
jgi:hypothetical protein